MYKQKVFYWSPSLVNIATNKAVINSAYSLNKYSEKYSGSIINFFGEFERFRNEINKKGIETINYYSKSIFKVFPSQGKIKSRFSFIVIFFMSFYPLKKLLKKEMPDYLIMHLITSLPLILLIFFNFKTKFILRISGFPKMNFFRKLLWKLAFKKIYRVTCPTKSTFNYIKSLNITSKNKIEILYDPVLEVNEINKKKREKKLINGDYFLAAGRLTKQKNFLFLCNAIKNKIQNNDNFKLLIAGEGEEKKELNKFIKLNNLHKKIILLNHVDNIFPYFVNAKAFILTSLWEDPGFVLIEAAYCRTLVFSCDSGPGPKELIEDDFNGIVFINNDIQNFENKFDLIFDKKNYKRLVYNNLKSIKKFTVFNHFKDLNKIMSFEN